MSSSNNVRLAVQAWGTPSAWRHVPRPPIRWVLSGQWVLSEPCQYIPCPLLPTTWSRVLSARHNIKITICLQYSAVKQEDYLQGSWNSCESFNQLVETNEQNMFPTPQLGGFLVLPTPLHLSGTLHFLGFKPLSAIPLGIISIPFLGVGMLYFLK